MTFVIENTVPLYVQISNHCEGHSHIFLGSITNSQPITSPDETLFVNDAGQFFRPFCEFVTEMN